ncbi:MAG: TRAP transporter substrate-binding protein, partial [Desulfobacteraceae bacterium]
MRKHRFFTTPTLSFILIAAMFFVGFSTVTYAKSIKLTYASHQPPTDVHSKLCQAWIDEVEKRTNGAVKVDFFPGESLVKVTQTYDAVENGMVDIGFAILQYTRGRFPLMDFINLPMGYPNGPINTAIINEVAEKFKPESLKAVKVLYFHANGPSYIHTKSKAIHTLKDFKGLKFRSNGISADALKELGGTPMALPMPELYQALQKGVIQGGVWDLSASVDWKLAEVTDYTIASSSISFSLGFFVVMNKDKWDSIDQQTQKIIEEINLEWVPKHGKAWQEADNRGISFSLQQGNSIIGITPKEAEKWRKTVQPVIDTWVNDMEKKNLPGKDVLEFVEERLEAAKKG